MDTSKIVADYGHLVSALAHRMIQDKELAREASQEVWYQVIKNLHNFNGNSQLSTWIYTIAKRTILRYASTERQATINQLKAFRALPEIEYSGDDSGKPEWIKQRCDWCLSALNHCLNNDARLIFTFRVNLELSYRQIGEIMEMKEETVRKIASRSIKKVSNFMKDTCPLYNPQGTCKCRIRKHIVSIDYDKEYLKYRTVIQLADLYKRLEKELPRKNYWEKFLL